MGVSKKTNQHSRKYPGANSPAPHNYKFRCEEGAERLAAYTALSVQERIDLLDRRLGKGVGAVKQRARLHALLAKSKAVVKSDEAPMVEKEKLRAKDRRATEAHKGDR